MSSTEMHVVGRCRNEEEKTRRVHFLIRKPGASAFKIVPLGCSRSSCPAACRDLVGSCDMKLKSQAFHRACGHEIRLVPLPSGVRAPSADVDLGQVTAIS